MGRVWSPPSHLSSVPRPLCEQRTRRAWRRTCGPLTPPDVTRAPRPPRPWLVGHPPPPRGPGRGRPARVRACPSPRAALMAVWLPRPRPRPCPCRARPRLYLCRCTGGAGRGAGPFVRGRRVGFGAARPERDDATPVRHPSPRRPRPGGGRKGPPSPLRPKPPRRLDTASAGTPSTLVGLGASRSGWGFGVRGEAKFRRRVFCVVPETRSDAPRRSKSSAVARPRSRISPGWSLGSAYPDITSNLHNSVPFVKLVTPCVTSVYSDSI